MSIIGLHCKVFSSFNVSLNALFEIEVLDIF